MNKTTLSLVAMAAVSVPVSAQDATPQETFNQLRTDIGVLIQKINGYDLLYTKSKEEFIFQLTTLQTELLADWNDNQQLDKGEAYYRNILETVDSNSALVNSYYTTFENLIDKYNELAAKKTGYETSLSDYSDGFVTYKQGQIDGLKIDEIGKTINGYKSKDENEVEYINNGNDLLEKSEGILKDIADKTTALDGLMANVNDKAATFDANADALQNLKAQVDAARGIYDTQLAGIVKLLSREDKAYDAWYKNAKDKELSAAANKIDEAWKLGNVANDDTKKVGYADDAVEATINSLLEDANNLLTTEPTVLTKYTNLVDAYEAAWSTVTGQETAFNKYVEGLKGAQMYDENKEAVDAIIAEIEALKNKLTEARETGNEDVTVFDITTEMKSITGKITTLQDKTQTAVAEYNAYADVTKALGDVEKALNEAVKKATETLSKDKAYNAGVHFDKTEEGIRKNIEDKRKAADASYKGGTAVADKDGYLTDVAGITASITTYGENTKAALAAYEAARKPVEDIKPSLTELTTTVGANTTVPILLDGYAGKTYGKVIETVKADTAAVATAIADANKKEGTAHLEAMQGVSYTEHYTAEQLAALKNSFAADKAHYDKQVTIDAAVTMFNLANGRLGNLNTQLDKIATGITDDACGDVQATALNGKLTELRGKIAEEITKLADEYAKVTPVKGAEETDEEYFNRQHLAATDFANVVNALIARIGSDGSSEIPVSGYNKDVKTLKDDLDKATKSYTNYKKLIDLLRDNDKSSVLKAIQAQREYIASKRGTYGAEGLDYYDNLLTETYEAQYNDYLEKLTTDLEEVRCGLDDATVVESQITALKKEIEQVTGKVEENETEHNAQVKVYTDKVGEDGNGGELNELYLKIQTDDKSDKATERLAKIKEARATIIPEWKTKIAEAFAAGKSKDNKEISELQKKVEELITELQKALTDDKEQDMLNTNLANHERFVAAYNNAKDTFSAAVKDLSLFASITDPELKEYVSGELLAVHNDIYAYVEKLRQLWNDENEAYNPYKATGDKTTELYEVGVWINLANEYNADIAGKMETYRSMLNGKAAELYNNKITEADGAIAAAKQELERAGYSEDTRKDAYADIAQSVNEAKEKAGLMGADGKVDPLFAYEIQPYLETLNDIDELIDAENDVLANKEWNYRKAEAETKIAWEAEQLAGFEPGTIIDIATGELKVSQERIDNAKKLNEGFVKDIKTAFEAYMEIAAGDRYEKLSEALAKLPKFDSEITVGDKKQMETTEFASIYNDIFADGQNKQAYEDIFAIVARTRVDLTGTIEFVNSFFEAHTDGSASANALNIIQNKLDNFLVRAEKGYTRGNCVSVLNDTKAYCVGTDDIASTISIEEAALRTNVIALFEPLALRSQINVLKGLYNDVVAQDINKSDKAIEDAINGFEAKITDVYNAYGTPAADEIAAAEAVAQAAYLKIEAEMASLYKTLTDMDTSKAGALDEAVASLNESCDDVETLLATIDTWFAEFAEIRDIEFGSPKQNYGEAVGDVKTALEAVKASIESRKADNSLLFYKDNLAADINGVKTELNNILKGKDRLEATYQKYRDNKDAYLALNEQIASLTASLDETYNKVIAYEEEGVQFPMIEVLVDADKEIYENVDMRTYWYNQIKTVIANSTDALNDSYAAVSLTKADAEAGVDNKKTIETMTGKLLSKSTYHFARVRIADKRNDVSGIIDKLNKYAPAEDKNDTQKNDIFRYLPSAYSELMGTAINLIESIDALNGYNNSASVGTLYNDINGNEIVDDKGVSAPVTLEGGYMDVAEEIEARYQELRTEVETLEYDAEARKFLVGDANGDNLVNVADYNTIRTYILDPDNSTYDKLPEAKAGAADVNGDREINVGDLTCVSNLVFHNNWAWTPDENTTAPAPAKARVLASVPAESTDGVSIAVESEETTIFGKKVRVAVNVDNTADYVGYQMDIKLPEGMTLAGENLTERANGHELMSADIAGGWHRVLVSTMENNAFAGTSGAMLYLDVEVSGDFKGGDVELGNVMFTDATGRVYKMKAAVGDRPTGITDITAPTVKERIYSVGGQVMKAVKKGVNIIVGSDGTTKKVFNK